MPSAVSPGRCTTPAFGQPGSMRCLSRWCCSSALMAVSIVLLRGGYMVLDQALELATLSAFTAYAVSIFDPIR